MRKKYSDQIKKEQKIIIKIENINAKKECFKILENPSQYFQPHFNNLQNPYAILFAKFSVLTIIREIDTSEEICEKTADFFMEKYPIITWLDKLISFYQYAMSTIDYIIEKHDNIILDMYNDKIFDKKTMIQGMTSFKDIKEMLIKDKTELEKCLAEMEDEKKQAEDMENS